MPRVTQPMPIVQSVESDVVELHDVIDYVPPKRFVVDDATSRRIEARAQVPRPPNEAIRSLFK